MTVIELKEFIFGNYYKRIRFSKENSYYSLKHQKKKDLTLFAIKSTKKIHDPCNAKKHCQPFIRKKNTK